MLRTTQVFFSSNRLSQDQQGNPDQGQDEPKIVRTRKYIELFVSPSHNFFVESQSQSLQQYLSLPQRLRAVSHHAILHPFHCSSLRLHRNSNNQLVHRQSSQPNSRPNRRIQPYQLCCSLSSRAIPTTLPIHLQQNH